MIITMIVIGMATIPRDIGDFVDREEEWNAVQQVEPRDRETLFTGFELPEITIVRHSS